MHRGVEVALQAAGIVGVALLLGAYAALQARRVTVGTPAYHAANAVGSALILGSLVGAFNLPSAVIESAWLVLSLWGGGRCWWAARAAAKAGGGAPATAAPGATANGGADRGAAAAAVAAV